MSPIQKKSHHEHLKPWFFLFPPFTSHLSFQNSNISGKLKAQDVSYLTHIPAVEVAVITTTSLCSSGQQ